MSMYGMGGFLGGVYGAAASHNAADGLPTSQPGVEQQRLQIQQLEDRLDRLSLICVSMWSLLLERTDLTEQHLMDRVEQIDLLDGKADGKVTRTVQKCRQCGRTMSPRHRRCLYCGAAELKSSAFDDVTG